MDIPIKKEYETRMKGLFLILIGFIYSNVLTYAQKHEIDMPAERVHRLSTTLQKKVAERMVELRARAADATGPIVDRVERDWTIEAADCSLVKSQMKLTGIKKNTVWVSPNDDGSFHLELRREASGTAVDAGGNRYMWIYNENSDLDLSDSNVTETTKIFAASGPDTFQLIALTPAGSGYTMAQYFKVDTPILFGDAVAPVASTAPLGCQPI